MASSELNNKTILITGAGGAFGLTCALMFAKENCNLILIDNFQSKLEETMRILLEILPPSKIITFGVSVADEFEVKSMMTEIETKFTTVDYLFNNAGIQGDFKNTKDYDHREFKRIMEINIYGVFNILQNVSNLMIKNRTKGSIVNVASFASKGSPNMIAYSASKAAVVGMTKTAAKDLAPYDIRVNCISPAFIGDCDMWKRQCELQAGANSQYYSTDYNVVSKQMIGMVPLRRTGTLEEVINVSKFLFGNGSNYITGQDLEVTGGL